MLQGSLITKDLLVLSANYEYEYLGDAMYGTGPIPNINQEVTTMSTVSVFASYGVTEWFGAAVVIPFRSITNDKILLPGQYDNQYQGGTYIRHAAGLGDVVLMMNFAPPLPEALPGLLFSAGVKLANGSTHAVDEYGNRFADLLQVGSGSLDPIFSVSLSRAFDNLFLSGMLFTRIISRENVYGYKYGNEFQGIFSMEYMHGEKVIAGLSLNHVHTARDYFQYGKIARKRGGTWLYLAPKLGIRATENLSLEARLPLPVYQNVNESQLTSDYQLHVGATYHFFAR